MNPTDTVQRTDDSSLGGLTCPICGEAQVNTYNHPDTIKYGSGESAVKLQVELPVRRCDSCDFEYLDQEGERIKHEAVCRHLGVLTSVEIRRIREQYGMTRSSFSQVTGLGEATLNRWENGVLIQNRANDCYLRLLAMHDIFDRLSRLPDRPFPSQELDPEAGGNRQDFSKATVLGTKRPPKKPASVHVKFHQGWKNPDMSSASKHMTLFPKVIPRKSVKPSSTPIRIARGVTKSAEPTKSVPKSRASADWPKCKEKV